MDAHYDLELMKKLALAHSTKASVNMNVIIANPVDGKFNREEGSTYEMVTDSYFDKDRPHALIVISTYEMLKELGIPDEGIPFSPFTKQV